MNKFIVLVLSVFIALNLISSVFNIYFLVRISQDNKAETLFYGTYDAVPLEHFAPEEDEPGNIRIYSVV